MAKSAADELQASSANIGAIIRRPPGAAAAAAARQASEAGAGAGLGALDPGRPSLPSAPKVLRILERMSRLHVCEKDAIVTTSRWLPVLKHGDLSLALERRDKNKEGVVTIHELFEELEAAGVPCEDLTKTLKDLTKKSGNSESIMIYYSDFMASVSEFQQNLQDSAAWAVFRSFDTNNGEDNGTVTKRDLTAALGEGKPLRETVADNFPQLPLEAVLQELDGGNREIDFDAFKRILRSAATNPRPPPSPRARKKA